MTAITVDQIRDFEAAHAEGLHDDIPREFCPPCDDDAPVACGTCGDTRTVELHGDDAREQSITICATCGSDE